MAKATAVIPKELHPKTLTASKKKGTLAKNTTLLQPIKRVYVTLKINSTATMVQHQWSAKAKEAIRLKHAGKKTKNREIRDPEQEGKDATYLTQDGEFSIPAKALKSAIISAAHKDIGIEKTLVRKHLFVMCDDPSGNLAMGAECAPPVIREDHVRVGPGSMDLRYRPYFYKWSVIFTIEMDASGLQLEDLTTLVDRAGFGVGIGEMRPEKGGDCGRFRIDETFKVQVKG